MDFTSLTTLYKRTGECYAPVVLPDGRVVTQGHTSKNPVVVDPNNLGKRQPKFPQIDGGGKIYPLFHNISNVPVWAHEYIADNPDRQYYAAKKIRKIDYYLFDCESNTLSKIIVHTRLANSDYSLWGRMDGNRIEVRDNTGRYNVYVLEQMEIMWKRRGDAASPGFPKVPGFHTPVCDSYQLDPHKWLVCLSRHKLQVWNNDKHQHTHDLFETVCNTTDTPKIKEVLGIPDVQAVISSFLVGGDGAFANNFGNRVKASKERAAMYKKKAVRDVRNARNREKARRRREIKSAKETHQSAIEALESSCSEIIKKRQELKELERSIPGLEQYVEQTELDVVDAEAQFEEDYPSRTRRVPEDEDTESDEPEDKDEDTESDEPEDKDEDLELLALVEDSEDEDSEDDEELLALVNEDSETDDETQGDKRHREDEDEDEDEDEYEEDDDEPQPKRRRR